VAKYMVGQALLAANYVAAAEKAKSASVPRTSSPANS
jgi:hypothetical protein